MRKIGLAEAIGRVREELTAAVAASDPHLVFPVKEVTLSFQVGMTTSSSADGRAQLWVLEAGAAGQYAHESVQTVTIVLGSPVDAVGNVAKVMSASEAMSR